MANQTGLSKARGHKKGQKRFWPVAAWQDWQKLAGWLQKASPAASLSLSLCRARALLCTQCSSPVHHTEQEYSCSVVCLCLPLCLNFIMISLSPPSLLKIYPMQQ